MRDLSEEQLLIALSRIGRGLTKYLWLQHHVKSIDMSTHREFQKRFSGFYRIRRGPQWRMEYFALLESSKLYGIEFPQALREINRRCGKLEASFSSKLVATLDPSKPVVDKFVLQHFALQLPRWGTANREFRIIDLYGRLCDKYCTLIESPTGKFIRELFDARFPSSGVSELKKVDLVRWQIRK